MIHMAHILETCRHLI